MTVKKDYMQPETKVIGLPLQLMNEYASFTEGGGNEEEDDDEYGEQGAKGTTLWEWDNEWDSEWYE